ncbi:hypothetical protein RQP46_005743 [Phenoliferia psychrophenolica]
MCSLRDLKSLRLEGSAADLLEIPKYTFPQFHLHHLFVTFPLTDADVHWFTASSTGTLRSCVLGNNPPSLTPNGLQHFLEAQGSTLNGVHLSLTQWTAPQVFDSALEGLSESNLSSLSLGGAFTPHVLDTLAPQVVATLKQLDISGLHDRIAAVNLLRFLRKADALQELDWHREGGMTVIPDARDPEREDWIKIHEILGDREMWVNGEKRKPEWGLVGGLDAVDETSEFFTSGLSLIGVGAMIPPYCPPPPPLFVLLPPNGDEDLAGVPDLIGDAALEGGLILIGDAVLGTGDSLLIDMRE